MRIILILATVLIASCSGLAGYNPSVFEYQFDQAAVDQAKIKKVVLANVNLGVPTRAYLRGGELRVKSMVSDYLSSNGFELAPDYLFENAWKQAIRNYGNPYDPTTGRIDGTTWQAVLVDMLTSLKKNSDIDAVIFADVIEHDVQHSIGMQHIARWYGVDRKPALEGTGDSVSQTFNWFQPVKAASLAVTVFSVDLQQLFSSRGGLDTLQGVDTRSSSSDPGFVRRKKLLQNEDNIEEGIELAFHPFIPMKNYPGQPEDDKKTGDNASE